MGGQLGAERRGNLLDGLQDRLVDVEYMDVCRRAPAATSGLMRSSSPKKATSDVGDGSQRKS